MGPDDLDELKQQMNIFLDSKIIRLSKNEWSFPVLLVVGVIIDYRTLNAITISDSYPNFQNLSNMFHLTVCEIAASAT